MSIVFVAGILVFAKTSSEGFNILWRYFAWSNQTIAVFAFSMITIYFIKNSKNYLISLLPGMFYMFIISSYILNAQIGLRLSMNVSYVAALVLTGIYAHLTIAQGEKLASFTQKNPTKKIV